MELKYLKGCGPQRAKALETELGITSPEALLLHFPRRMEDRSRIYTIDELREGMSNVQIRGQFVAFGDIEGVGRRRRLTAMFSDGTGYVNVTWFNGLQYVTKNLKVQKTYILFGKPDIFRGRFSFQHPEIEEYEPESELQNREMAVRYPMTTKLVQQWNFTQKVMSNLVATALQVLPPFEETLTPALIHHHGLLTRDTAIRAIHRPASSVQWGQAEHRLKFEELFYLQLSICDEMQQRKQTVEGFVFPVVGEKFHQFFRERMPFELTDAQKRVMHEIREDMRSGNQMNRLLQGDVGSGKTMVALMTCLIGVDNGFQACLMAPTEILAEQHYATLREQLGDMPVRVELLTGAVKGKQRKLVFEGIKDGSIDILVGTHALIEPKVVFKNLGIAVIDEQHRFGVKQRAEIWNKNTRPPHILVMSATPIPRTLAMTLYGDLDVSIIDQLPPGRKPIRTVHYFSEQQDRVRHGIIQELLKGHQVYVVYPLIDENEALQIKALEQGYDELQNFFTSYRVEKIHGRMKSEEKEQIMRRFQNHETHILVSTTVIEVGVNVPNASVMVIIDAQRFGLSQLHQLRGRVGRGAEQSFCVLVTPRKLVEASRRRMEIMCETTNGFRIAEEDLNMRGSGDLEGTMQSGLPFQLQIANIVRDNVLMSEAREAAIRIVKADPEHNNPEFAVLWRELDRLKASYERNYSGVS